MIFIYNVLHILTGEDGGISAVVRDYYTYINREKFHFDVACITENEGNDIAKIKHIGADVFHLPKKSSGIKEYIRALKEILSKKQYDAIHVHENETSYVALKVAKELGIKCRIAHAHTSAPYISVKNEIRRISGIFLNYHYASNVIACGELAGNRVFGKFNMKRKKAVVLTNAIDLEKYQYNENVRTQMREELGISDRFAVGFIGRLANQKNPMFCVSVIKKLHEINSNAVLVMAGDGDMEEQIQDFIIENGMQEYVRMLGKRTDAERLYQAFDAFVLPSLYEGFPLVAIEALASGLNSILSTNITNELSSLDKVSYLDIFEESDWVNTLNTISKDSHGRDRLSQLDPNIYDIKFVVKKLERIYIEK